MSPNDRTKLNDALFAALATDTAAVQAAADAVNAYTRWRMQQPSVLRILFDTSLEMIYYRAHSYRDYLARLSPRERCAGTRSGTTPAAGSGIFASWARNLHTRSSRTRRPSSPDFVPFSCLEACMDTPTPFYLDNNWLRAGLKALLAAASNKVDVPPREQLCQQQLAGALAGLVVVRMPPDGTVTHPDPDGWTCTWLGQHFSEPGVLPDTSVTLTIESPVLRTTEQQLVGTGLVRLSVSVHEPDQPEFRFGFWHGDTVENTVRRCLDILALASAPRPGGLACGMPAWARPKLRKLCELALACR